eukprot:Skav228826  [mRNA]  locus=scaffold359:575241:575654:- [translate_table: standard]
MIPATSSYSMDLPSEFLAALRVPNSGCWRRMPCLGGTVHCPPCRARRARRAAAGTGAARPPPALPGDDGNPRPPSRRSGDVEPRCRANLPGTNMDRSMDQLNNEKRMSPTNSSIIQGVEGRLERRERERDECFPGNR